MSGDILAHTQYQRTLLRIPSTSKTTSNFCIQSQRDSIFFEGPKANIFELLFEMAHFCASGYDSEEEFQELLEYLSTKKRKMEFNHRLVATLMMPTRHPMGPKAKYEQPFSWNDHLAMLTPRTFTDRYRVMPAGFDILYELVKDKLVAKDEVSAKNSRGESKA